MQKRNRNVKEIEEKIEKYIFYNLIVDLDFIYLHINLKKYFLILGYFDSHFTYEKILSYFRLFWFTFHLFHIKKHIDVFIFNCSTWTSTTKNSVKHDFVENIIYNPY